MTTTSIRPSHILWDVTNRKHWEIAAKGTLEHCEKELEEWSFGSLDQAKVTKFMKMK